jgi:phosphodiesterase/alkaline phosphatase D-like protein
MKQFFAYIFFLLCFQALGVAERLSLSHGPMLGMPTSDSVLVWGRTNFAGEFWVRYGTSRDQLTQISAKVKTHWEDDNTASVKLTGLEANTRYYYQVYLGEKDRPHGQWGSFKTMPSSAVAKNQHNPEGLFNFKFQIGSCSNQSPENGIGHNLPTYQVLNRDWADKVNFAIMNGDWLYEEWREYPAEAWRLIHGLNKLPRNVELMPNVVGVWENYKAYLSRADALSKWHRFVPNFFTFDDHELVNDIWGAGTAGRRHRRSVFRDIGTVAFYDYLGWANPTEYSNNVHAGRASLKKGSDLLIDLQTNFKALPLEQMENLHVHWGTTTAGVNDMTYDVDEQGNPNSYVYDIIEIVDEHTLRLHMPAKATDTVNYSIGRRSYGKKRYANCEFYFIDTRTSRDMHDITKRDQEGLSMLGQTQYQWLVNSMKESDAEFFFVISSVPFMIPHSGAGGFEADFGNKEEAWTGFLDEREKLIQTWEEIDKPVMVMTGDLHNSFAIEVTDKIWEFCCGPHNSVNHMPKADEWDRPATGKFDFGGRVCDIKWSSYIMPDVPRMERFSPHFAVVNINNVFNSPLKMGDERLIPYPHPQVIIQYYDGYTGDLVYAQPITTDR